MSKLNFKLRGKQTSSVVKDTLRNNGLTDLVRYCGISMTNTPMTSPEHLFNIDKAYERYMQAINNNEAIGILVDGDVDGMSSAALLYKVTKRLSTNVHFIVSDEKTHGLKWVTDELIDNHNLDLVITPDAATNDIEWHNKLSKAGINVIVLDHHQFDSHDNTPAIIVNNQSDFNDEVNTNYVGVGMVYLFLRYLNKKLNNQFNEEDWLSLVALGQITDMSDIANDEIHAVTKKGLELFENHKLFKLFITNTPSPHEVAFNIAPKMNAIARVGSQQQRLNLLYSLAQTPDDSKLIDFQKSKKNHTTGKFEKHIYQLTVYECEYEELKKVKSKQDRIVAKTVEDLFYLGKADNLAIAKIPSNITPSVTGLIAARVASKFKVPALVVRENPEDIKEYMGSMRSPEDFPMRTWLNDTQLVKASGHEQASGVEFRKNNTEDLLNLSSSLNLKPEAVYVDALYNENNASISPINDINNNIGLFGGSLSEPVLGFEGIPVRLEFISYNGKVMKFTYNNIQFILFNGLDIREKFNSELLYFDILGSASENTWMGRKTPQVIINKITISEKKQLGMGDFVF